MGNEPRQGAVSWERRGQAWSEGVQGWGCRRPPFTHTLPAWGLLTLQKEAPCPLSRPNAVIMLPCVWYSISLLVLVLRLPQDSLQIHNFSCCCCCSFSLPLSLPLPLLPSLPTSVPNPSPSSLPIPSSTLQPSALPSADHFHSGLEGSKGQISDLSVWGSVDLDSVDSGFLLTWCSPDFWMF